MPPIWVTDLDHGLGAILGLFGNASAKPAEISMRLKQLKQFWNVFSWYFNPLRINTIVRIDQKIPHSCPFTP